LRHAAGADKYTKSTGKISARNNRAYGDDMTIGDVYFKPKKGKHNPSPKFDKFTGDGNPE